METYEAEKRDIIEVGKLLYQKSMVAANDGNISIRVKSDHILITPSGVNKGLMNRREIIAVNLQGNVVSGSLKPSSELDMHLEIYRQRPEIKAVVHAHPLTATGFAAAGVSLPKSVLPEVVIRLGTVPLVEYATPSIGELASALSKYLKGHDAFLLENHGALTIGADIWDAYHKMETLEFLVRVILVARQLGGERELTATQVEKLMRIKKDITK